MESSTARDEHLGKTAKDKVTGFVGIITGVVQYMTGCDQYLLTPHCDRTEHGRVEGGHWLDVNRLEIDEAIDQIILDTEVDSGPCGEAPKY